MTNSVCWYNVACCLNLAGLVGMDLSPILKFPNGGIDAKANSVNSCFFDWLCMVKTQVVNRCLLKKLQAQVISSPSEGLGRLRWRKTFQYAVS